MPRPKSPVRLEWVDPAVCSLEYRLKIIGRLPFFRHLPAEAIAEINRLFEDRDVPAEQAIYFEGDPGEYLYLVAMGKIKLLRHTASGRDVLLDLLRGGEYFGSLALLGGHGYTETAVAQTDCCILHISSANFEKILNRYPDVSLKVLQAVGQRLEGDRAQQCGRTAAGLADGQQMRLRRPGAGAPHHGRRVLGLAADDDRHQPARRFRPIQSAAPTPDILRHVGGLHLAPGEHEVAGGEPAGMVSLDQERLHTAGGLVTEQDQRGRRHRSDGGWFDGHPGSVTR